MTTLSREKKNIFTFSELEFQELLTDESHINIGRLREAARYGVPQSVRGEVWKILLFVSKPDKSEELSARKRMQEEFRGFQRNKTVSAETRLRARTNTQKYVNDRLDVESSRKKDVRMKLEEMLLVYLSVNPTVAYDPRLIHVASPFLGCIEELVDAYYCFSQFMLVLTYNPVTKKIGKTLSNFLMLFRSFQAELCGYFEDEELEPNEWALSWLQNMLAGALPHECTLRLWDTYFSSEEGWDLHIYVCLAILRQCSEDLMELEYSQLLEYLQDLPPMDMDQIIMHAYNVRSEVIANKLLLTTK